ncbi:hypothetical protein [Streptosporangium roseum]|uniref:hypothetical protein n=1 Tax=Streptosporangium roseum TaxID=2001 RepID=UPI0001A39901|nr:hypothetical protein [Streptosporangium roseum]
MTFKRWWLMSRKGAPGVARWWPSAALCGLAVAVVVASTADVLVAGPLRRWDQHVMLGVDGLRVTGWPHAAWRVIVIGGQFWLVASLVMIAAVAAAWRRRDLPLAAAVSAWPAGTSMVSGCSSRRWDAPFPAQAAICCSRPGSRFPPGMPRWARRACW